LLCTILKPTAGTASVNGFDILKNPSEVRKSIGIVFQEPSSDELLTAYENLKVHCLIYGVEHSQIDKRINEVLNFMDLADRANDLLKTYSGGMRRRLEIARALIHRPAVLFLDEPSLGLDPRARTKIWDYIKNLSKEFNITIMLTTHYMEEADFLANRLLIIDRGKEIVSGRPAELKGLIAKAVVKIKTPIQINISKFKKKSYISNVELKNDEYIFTLNQNNKETLIKLLKELKNISHIEILSPSSNDVFIKYTGHEIEEGQDWFAKVLESQVQNR
jgi:ABC-2 type transport system ATP-binding protein